jgi:selenocysteine-specific elongation factor
VVYTLDGYAAAVRRVEQTLEAFHKRTPLRAGMPRSELRQRLGLTPHAFDALLAALSGNGTIRDSEPVALASFKPNLSPAQLDIADGYVAVLRSLPYSPPTDTPVDGDLLAYLVAAGEVIDAGDGIVFAATAYADMTDSVLEHIRTRGPITLAQVRDMFGTTRKYAQALLETMDRQHLTRRVGDERILYRTEG